MNTYSIEDLSIGQIEKFQVAITEAMMSNFLEITQDTNPLHQDKKFAKEKGFSDKVVYGMLTASFISTLGGVFLPGRDCLIQSVEIKFVKPVFVGDTLTIYGKVTEIHETVQQVEIKVTIINQEDKKVVKGKLKVGFLNG